MLAHIEVQKQQEAAQIAKKQEQIREMMAQVGKANDAAVKVK